MSQVISITCMGNELDIGDPVIILLQNQAVRNEGLACKT